jgi:hypothetical protein
MTTRSGYLNNSPKVVVIGDDNRPGSYPSHASPVDIAKSQGSDGLRPYRDDMQPSAVSPYARAQLKFITRIPAPGSSITLTSASGVISTFNFKVNPPSFNPSPGVYEIDTSGIWVGSTDTAPTSLKAAQLVSQRFVSAVSRATGSQIIAELSLTPGEVILTQAIPGSAGNTTITTTVSSSRLSVSSFSGGSSIQVRYPYAQLVDDSNPQTTELIRRVIKSERSGTLSAPGILDPRRLIGPSDGHPYVNYSPFDETNSWQSFGVSGGSELYGTQTELYEDFFTRGSVSGSLDEPLSAKDKIVIDLAPVETTVLKYTNTASISSYGMAYYNFSNRKWEGVGTGYNSIDFPGSLLQAHDAVHAGFSPSCFSGFKFGSGASESGWASCTDTFGFPVHPKYHATSSQVLSVSSLVDRPFLVEKIVYEFSGSSDGKARLAGTDPNDSALYLMNNCGATFFILNQRTANPDRGQDTSYTTVHWNQIGGDYYASPDWSGSFDDEPPFSTIYTASLPITRSLSRSGSPVYVDGVRDIVTFARIGAVWSSYQNEIVENLSNDDDPHPAKFMDLALEVPNSGTYSGNFIVAANVKTPEFNSVMGTYSLYSGGNRVFVSKNSYTRNALDIPTGRAYNSEYCSSPTIRFSLGRTGNSDQIISIKKEDADISPYLIKPGDNLVFGWQSPLSFSFAYDGESFSIGPGKGKLILYGSYLQDDKPVHDIYKDQLISDSIHEAIPAGPAVLDVFDTEPTMVYSGSLREEYVRGTMIERTGFGSIYIPPVESKKARKVRGRASDGNLGSRYSFFKNTRLFDLGAQYYDSMQLNPVDVLMKYSGSQTKVARVTVPPLTGETNFLFIGAPGESYTGPNSSVLESAANRKLIGSFAFENGLYENIERVKSINSILFSNSRVKRVDFSTSSPVVDGRIDVIGYITGSSISSTTSSLIRPGGLTKSGLSGFAPYNNGFFYPQSSPAVDTNPSDDDTSQYAYAGPIYDGVYNFISPSLDIEGVNYHISRFLGCFGDGFMDMCQYSFNLFLYDIYPPIPFDVDPTFPYPFPVFPFVRYLPITSASTNTLYGQIYRGTRYGLINAIPQYANCVFSGTKYGQFRDMLEQRQFTVFEDKNQIGPVEVRFIDRSTGESLPAGEYSGTNSINLSPYCTSSFPYFEGEVRDRSLPLPEQSTIYTP